MKSVRLWILLCAVAGKLKHVRALGINMREHTAVATNAVVMAKAPSELFPTAMINVLL